MQVASLLPEFMASVSEHDTSTVAPGFTGNCVVVSSMLVHSCFRPVQSGCGIAV